MDILELLKKLKTIEPDTQYALKSKNIILSRNISRSAKLTLWSVVLEGIKSGSAIALAAVLLLVIFGGISIWKTLFPSQLSGLDPTSLRAEAQDIDIQIQLTNIDYNEPLHNQGSSLAITKNPSSTLSAPLEIGKKIEEKAKELGLSSPTSSITIDQVLEKLSQ